MKDHVPRLPFDKKPWFWDSLNKVATTKIFFDYMILV